MAAIYSKFYMDSVRRIQADCVGLLLRANRLIWDPRGELHVGIRLENSDYGVTGLH